MGVVSSTGSIHISTIVEIRFQSTSARLAVTTLLFQYPLLNAAKVGSNSIPAKFFLIFLNV